MRSFATADRRRPRAPRGPAGRTAPAGSRRRRASAGRARTASGPAMSLPLGADVVGVAEPHGLDGDGQREGDDGDREPPDAQRRESDQDADDRRAERGEERRERERDVPASVRERAEEEPGDAGQRELGERDLPGVAGHDDERERDDRQDEAGDERRPPRPPAARGGDRRRRAVPTTAGVISDRGRGARPSVCWMITPRLGSGFARATNTRRISSERDQLGEAGGRQPAVLAAQVDDLGLDHADRQAAEDGRDHERELAEDRGRQRRDDEQGVPDRGERDDRGDEDARRRPRRRR